jgi:hypothetical protein
MRVVTLRATYCRADLTRIWPDSKSPTIRQTMLRCRGPSSFLRELQVPRDGLRVRSDSG